VDDNAKIATPVRADYHFAEDITDRAIANLKARDTTKPFFLYYAASIAHEPMQVPKSYIDAYNGVYDQGWDKLRAARFDRMKQMGVIPKDTRLPPINPGDPAWDTLSAEQKKVYARFMQTYAGFLTHGDEQIGRVLTYLRETGLDRNTLVVLISDNGAASEGIGNGGFRRPYFDTTPLSEMAAHLDELGSPSTVALYQRPWAMTGSAPFQRYKLYPYLGGVRTPMMISWPGKIGDAGAVRSQHVDAVDIAPTIADAVGLKFDDTVDGAKQIPVAGRSFLPALKSAKAPSPRNVQYFELRGNRAIALDNWRAVAMHKPGTSFDTDDWKLFDLSKDFSEAENLAARYPDQLAKMKTAWQREAEKYGVLPLTEMSPLMQSRSFMKSEFAD
jgi:arylsulfatase